MIIGAVFIFEDLQLFQGDILTSAFRIFGFRPLQDFHLGISGLLKKCTFTYAGSDAIWNQPEKAVHQSKRLRRMQNSMLRTVKSVSRAVERVSSFSVL